MDLDKSCWVMAPDSQGQRVAHLRARDGDGFRDKRLTQPGACVQVEILQDNEVVGLSLVRVVEQSYGWFRT